MRMSELARAAELPVATVKYYLRDGLLHEGRRTAATQAEYDESHLRRLHLIRALTGPAALSLAATRSVLAVLEEPPTSAVDLLGAAHAAVAPPVDDSTDTTRVRGLLDRWGWADSCHEPATIGAVAQALHAMEAAGFDPGDEKLDGYARSMFALAQREIADTPLDSAEEATRHVVLGTVLVEPLLLSLRRLAQSVAAHQMLGQDQGDSTPASSCHSPIAE